MPRQSSVQPGNRRPVPTSNPKGRVPAQMDQLGVRRVRRLPCGRYQPPFRKAGTPHRWTFSLSSPFFRDLRNRKRQPQIGPRSCAGFRQFRSARGLRRIEDGGHAVLQVGDPIRKAEASFGATENANRRLGLVRVRGPASSDPRGAYAASKTADTPYSKLATQSARLGLHPRRPKTPTADWASFVCGVPPVQIRAGLTPHRRRRTRRTPSWRRCSGGLAGVWVDRSPGPGRGAQEVTARANASAVRLWAWAKPPTSRAARTETSTSPKSPNENNSADLGNRSRYASRASA